VGPIAQSVEQRTFNPWVDGSSPSGPTYFSPHFLEAIKLKPILRFKSIHLGLNLSISVL
jgi:hypothetical protein